MAFGKHIVKKYNVFLSDGSVRGEMMMHEVENQKYKE